MSACGHPGDMGNSLGVGQYCNEQSDAAPACPTGLICSDIENSSEPANLQTFFCTLPECTACTSCGTGASCVCQAPGACGCVPDTCAGIFPDGGSPPACAEGGTGSEGGTDAGAGG
jgi:hypothetical protein